MEVKDYIITEADKLFCQYGFKSVTMDDIAKHLGVSKKTIYQNFKDKNELINILIRDRILN
ncbi:MAG: TetR/AcrR family transcriptional regulator, partial [Pedobacter sp.]